MRRASFITVVLVASVVIAVLAHSRYVLKEKLRKYWLTQHQAEILGSCVLLQQLRAGSSTNALELLEMRFDSEVFILSQAMTHSDSSVSNEIRQTLQLAKQYRDKYPRKTEANLGPDERSVSQEMQIKAAQTLSKLN